MDPLSPLPAMSPLPAPATVLAPPHDWRWWMHRLLVCNPFFLVSAALLLFGVNRLSVDPGFLNGEESKLLFNFGALQLYGVLLAATAVLLARRKVWYDSALLVVLEHGLVLVPFILISQAALIGTGLAATLVLFGALTAAARAGAVRRWYPQFNLSARALALGTVILVANVALPLWFRSVVNATSVVDWPGPNRFVWFVVLPLLAAGANLLPRPVRHDGPEPQRPWLPLLIYGLWLGGSGVHAASVAYLGKGSELSPALFAPLALVIGWTVWNRLRDIVPLPVLTVERACLGSATAAPLLAVGEARVLLLLAVANVIAFGVLRWRRADPLGRFAGKLAFGSGLIALLGVPEEWLQLTGSGLNRFEFLFAATGLCAVAASWFSRRPVIGLCGGLTLVLGLLRTAGQLPDLFVWQVGFVVTLCHSLRWDDAEPSARPLRGLLAGAWLLSAYLPHRDGWLDLVVVQGLLVLAAWCAAWWLSRRMISWTIPCAAVGVGVSQPAGWAMQNGSPGLFAIAASFVLFGVGTLLAWRRRHPEPGME